MPKTNIQQSDNPKNRSGASDTDAKVKAGSAVQGFDPGDYDYDKYEKEGFVFQEPGFAENIYHSEPFTAPKDFDTSDEDQSYDEILGTKSSSVHPARYTREGDMYFEDPEEAEREDQRALAETELTGASEFARKRVDLDPDEEFAQFERTEDDDFEEQE